MRGLEVSRQFFFSAGVPFVASEFPQLMGCMAAGLVGEGSECFGIDDHHSRDHDWGAGFCLWLPRDEFQCYGAAVAEGLSLLAPPEGLPSRFARLRTPNDGRVGVFAVDDFYRRFIGFGHAPRTVREWWAIPDANLATAVNGAVFCDRAGEFTRWRQALQVGYPRDVRLKKMAYCCYVALQAGPYNHRRMAARGLGAAAGICEAVFMVAALRLVYYLNGAYPPYYKWLHPLVKALPLLGEEAYGWGEELAAHGAAGAEGAVAGKQAVMEQWCAALEQAMAEQGYVDSARGGLYAIAQQLHGAIEEPWLRRIPLEVKC